MKLWTVGHSTRTFDELVGMLKNFTIECVVDVRHYPGSKKYPHFNKNALQDSLPKNGINYIHCISLGGRRKVQDNSANTAWRHPAFQGYADYMVSSQFKAGIDKLKETAENYRTAIMCSEAVWWRCHRSMIADQLKADGWKVMHILSFTKLQEHPYTAPAKIVNGKLTYNNNPGY